MKLAMIGTGYVGLVSGVCFAEFGFHVTCVDKNPSIIERLTAGKVTIFEPGLDELMARNIRDGRLEFSTDLATSVADADVILIAVGTPSRRGDGEADLQYIEAAADEIAAAMKPGAVVVIKSTVVVGTNARIRDRIAAARPGVQFSMVSNPEFLREGSAIEDFMRPDRVVVGVDDERGKAAMQRLYRPLYLRETPMVVTSLENAEIIKYAANAFLAMKVTFINQVADLCEKTGGNVQEVARAIGMDNRIGSKFLHAGPGFGGSCFPKDTRAFAATGKKYDAPQSLIEEVIAVNEARKQSMAERIVAAAHESGTKTVAVLGIAFKPNTDDIRESPSLDIVTAIQKAGISVRAHDPEAMEAAKSVLPDVTWCGSAYEAAQGAGVVALLTEWNAYRALDLKRLASVMEGKVLMDLRNVYKADDVVGTGLDYRSVGRALKA
ncbi:UDP-glucose dehydrogenase family protein [Ochrobactrum quorumnocens]|jgi:UDPglucose 6-dehydrogenase|uniref:UDP-glucose 6-dehydrogenase n=1 Tax=Ochrobactrum quorumnocens TaxID=271865 RepID=A0A248UHJ3_9HYPH|nr:MULTISPECIES: UDP-glucose/GDP-mannose dehydrogenase family protein [Brucella]ASV86297.1 nucleotide sugar dehydrogenase family protein [[Ochrobactrum] quorumnocens]KAA9366292.1 UDP-glucose/GDP-mannose dehydrogenase family protein [[Ochrobactrum] quorumnocens]MBD7992400.1 UDP-glucose/GDP-mannose dehydrogenase family protein [Ochrobactrum gallinarum]MCV9908433.1 UDP-glucose/GDP-mannose dehydrogenase family protein [Brucella sp. HL-2]